MPLTRNQADSMIRRLRLPFFDEDDREVGDLNITYRPNLLSRAEFRRLQELAEGSEDDDDRGLAPLLCRAILGWDFVQDDGQPYPIEPDSMDLLGYPVQIEIVREMTGAPNPTNGKRSGRTSATNRILPAIESGNGSTASSPAATGTSMRGY